MSLRLAMLLAVAGCSGAPPASAPVVQAADLAARPLPVARPQDGCGGPTDRYVVEGVVTWTDGGPAADLPVGFGEGVAVTPGDGGPVAPTLVEVTRTDATGAYRVELDRAGLIGVVGERTTRPATCVRPPVATPSARESFVVAHACPTVVQVRGPRGAPVSGARVRWEARQQGVAVRGEGAALSDAEGYVPLDDLPCGEVAVRVERSGLAQTRADTGVPAGMRAPCLVGDVDAIRTCFRVAPPANGTADGTAADGPAPIVGVEMGAAVALRGRVTDRGGTPIAGAQASLLLIGDTVTDADGRWEMWVAPSVLREQRFLTVRSPFHADATVDVFGPDDAGSMVAATAGTALAWQRDLELAPTRRVAIRCAGLDADSCRSVLLTCAIEGERPIRECTDGDPVACECPVDPAHPSVVAGGGASVYVPAESTSVWLDFRPVPGSIVGKADGPGCAVRAERHADAPLSAPESRAVPCGPEGAFVIEHVPDGAWEVRVMNRRGVQGPSVLATVAGGVVDLGALASE